MVPQPVQKVLRRGKNRGLRSRPYFYFLQNVKLYFKLHKLGVILLKPIDRGWGKAEHMA